MTMAPTEDQVTAPAIGAAMAAIMAGGIGAFAMGLFVILNEAGVFAAPAIYGPSGGVSGRTTFAVVVWLIAWVVLHSRWKGRQVDSGRVFTMALILIGLGVLFTFPPLWGLL
jgi:hypothetical protein